MKNLLTTLAVIGILATLYFVFYKIPVDRRHQELESRNIEIKGELLTFDIQEGIVQNGYGNKIKPIRIELKYYYNYKGKRYENKELILWQELSTSEQNLVYNKHNNFCLIIKLEEKNPQKALAILTNCIKE